MKVVVEFQGKSLNGMKKKDEVEAVVELSKGEPINLFVQPVVGTDRWRLTFDVKIDGRDPVEARAFLKGGDDVLSETWLGQLIAEHLELE